MQGASPSDADDLAQEAFVVALRKNALDADPAALAVFLRRTGRFLLIRHRGKSEPVIAMADAIDQLWQASCEPDDGNLLVDAARQCIEQLEGRARRAIELGYGFDRAEPSSRATIAAELGMKENGVKTLLQRLRRQLRQCIERGIKR